MTAKIKALKDKHRQLEDEIERLQCWPSLAPDELKRLKLEKLKVKDEISLLESRQPEAALSP